MRLIRMALMGICFFFAAVTNTLAKLPETVFSLIEAKKYEEAETIVREQIKTSSPDDAQACRFVLAFLLMKQGNFVAAQELIRSIDVQSEWSDEGKFLLQTYSAAILPLPSPKQVETTVRVSQPTVRIRIGQSRDLTIGRDRFRCFGNKIKKNSRIVSSPYELPLGIVYQGRTYRGKMEMMAVNGWVVLVNTLPVEEYLYGVVRNEIAPGWNVEALKAQAIASRTFVLRRMQLVNTNGLNALSADVSVQVYQGIGSEDSRITAAIDATRGQVLMFQSELVDAVFHAESGGFTESSEELWGKAYPYLISNPDPYAGHSPRSSWDAEFGEAEILKSMDRESRSRVGNIKNIQISDKTSSGRVKQLLIKGKHGQVHILAGKFRLKIGPDRLRSLLWTDVNYENRRLTVKGRGWGHGVGLPQWSAKAAAEQGVSVGKILEFYYPGTKIVTKY